MIPRVFRRSRRDVGVALSLFLIGAGTGLLYCRLYTGAPQYYQEWFGPAVMLASGRGFANPDTTRAPEIQRFLDLKRGYLSRDDIPADTPTGPLNVNQGAHPYLLLSVGLWWRLAGISWHQVAAINAVLYGLATVSVYAIFRLAARRALAVLGALLLCFSATQLENLVHLRDYSKAPFILAAISIIGTVALRPLPRRGLLGLSALCGTILGIGTGFRPDVATVVPIFVLVLLCFHGSKPWHMLLGKLMALAVFALGFAVFAGPILISASSTGSNMSHVIILGLTDPFDANLRIDPSMYSFGHHYNDAYVESVVGSYAERLHDPRRGISPFSPATTYERMGSKYLLALGRQFPADMLTRSFAAVAAVLELPFVVLDYHLDPRVPFREPATRMYATLGVFEGLGVPLAMLLLLGLAVTRLKYALFAAFVLFALSGVSALQFHLRHHFHLQFISILGMLLLVDSLLLIAGRATRAWRFGPAISLGGSAGTWLPGLWRALAPKMAGIFPSVGASRAAHPAVRAGGRVVLMTLLIASTSIVPLWCLRRHQESDLKRLFRAYQSAEKHDVHPIVTTENPGRVLVTWDGAQGKAFGAGHHPTDYYVMEVASDTDLAIGAIEFKYTATSSFHDLSWTTRLTFRKGVNRIFFPVYSNGYRQFTRLEVGEGLRKRLRGIFRVTRLEDKPLLLDVHLAPNWERERLFQKARAWERPESMTVYSAFPPGSAFRHGWIAFPQSLTLHTSGLDVEWNDPVMVKPEGPRILVNGKAQGRWHYLVQFKKVAITKGALLVARGRLERGGLVLGLLKDDRWYRQVTIDQPGEFVAAVEVEQAGAFVPMITNAIASIWDRRNQAIITGVGILDPHDSQ